MPVVVAWIGEMLLTVVGQLVINGLIAAGIGFATHAVFHATGLNTEIRTWLGSAGPLYDWVGFFGLDTAMTIILSALAAKAVTDSAKAYLTENFHPKLKGGSTGAG